MQQDRLQGILGSMNEVKGLQAELMSYEEHLHTLQMDVDMKNA